VLTPRLGRAVARALLPAALLTSPLLLTVTVGAVPAIAATSASGAAAQRSLAAPIAAHTGHALSSPTLAAAARRIALRRAAARRAAAHQALIARRGLAVARWALRHVGAGYSAGSTGPYAFDCSGLTLAAWATQGVALPHYSLSQFYVVRHISLRQLRPGDLLFYLRYGAHHVAIYVGRGLMVSADTWGEGVRLEPILFSWFGSHFSGAGRVLR